MAGIDIDGNCWIRPVCTRSHGALTGSEITVFDQTTQRQRTMKPLDLVELSLHDPVGTIGQPENWTLGQVLSGESPRVLCQAGDYDWLLAIIKRFALASDSLDFLLGTPDKAVPHSEIEKAQVKQSLCLIRPRNLTWVRSTKVNNAPRIEGSFNFGRFNTPYRLPLTDISWEKCLLEQTLNRQTLNAAESPGMDSKSEMLMTISLGENFATTGCHYKLIAGVLIVPAI